MRVALFSEHDPAIPCGTAPTIAALIGHSPDDIQIVSYHLHADRFWGLRARQILQRAEQERIDLIHLAACGPSAIIAMLVAWRLGVPIVGSFSADFSSTSLGQRYVRALSKKCERVLTHSAAARDRLTAAGVEPSRIATWRPGVDTHIFTPSKRSAGLRERWEVSDVRPAVAYVGALSDEKCPHRLVSSRWDCEDPTRCTA
jgi:glycosyltransferase involved in cell wall biosynthesis